VVALLVLVVGGYILSSPRWGSRGAPRVRTARAAGTTTYRGPSSQWAFLAHRVSGFLVFAFLLLHVVDVSLVRWPSLYNDVHRLYGNILLRLFEVGLLLSLLFHALNGLRIIAVDLFPGAVANERRLLTGAVALTLAAGIPGAVVILWPFLSGRL
jgi:succinate dehydrogenase / fumarate reductase cytochrome b subunit